MQIGHRGGRARGKRLMSSRVGSRHRSELHHRARASKNKWEREELHQSDGGGEVQRRARTSCCPVRAGVCGDAWHSGPARLRLRRCRAGFQDVGCLQRRRRRDRPCASRPTAGCSSRQKDGLLKEFDSLTDTTPTTVLDLRRGRRRLLGSWPSRAGARPELSERRRTSTSSSRTTRRSAARRRNGTTPARRRPGRTPTAA